MAIDCVSTMSLVKDDQKLIFAICFGLLSVTATILNAFVLLLFCLYRELRTSLNKFLISLAIGDLILGAFLGPINIAQLTITYQNCAINISGRFMKTLMAISGVTLACIAYDRYLHVSSINTYLLRMTKLKLNILIILPWFSPLLLVGAKLIGKFTNVICVIILITTMYAVFLVSYWKLLVLVRETGLRFVEMDTEQLNKIKIRNKKVINFVGLIMFSTMICTTPILFNKIGLAYVLSGQKWRFYENNFPCLFAVGHLLFILNSCLNPILYFFYNTEFRRVLLKTIRKRSKVSIKI